MCNITPIFFFFLLITPPPIVIFGTVPVMASLRFPHHVEPSRLMAPVVGWNVFLAGCGGSEEKVLSLWAR